MLTLDVFQDDAFGVITLTAAINMPPEGEHVPGIVDDLFHESGISTLVVQIERQGQVLTLVPAAPRGAPGDVTTGPSRNMIAFTCAHLPTTGNVSADEVQGVRAFGTLSELQSLQALVNQRLQTMRKRLEATLAYQRMGAVKGLVLDADGSTPILNVFHAFGVEQQVQGMGLNIATTDVRQVAVTAKRRAEDALGDSAVIRGYRALCGRDFFDGLVAHPNVQEAYQRWQSGDALRADLRQGFRLADIEWREYYGMVNGIPFIQPDEAYLIPMGVDELFITRFGPANYIDTVNTMGVPFYASQKIMDHNKGVSLEAQSNPLTLCTRPRAIIRLTMQAPASGPNPPTTAIPVQSAKPPSMADFQDRFGGYSGPKHPVGKAGHRQEDDRVNYSAIKEDVDKLVTLVDAIAVVVERNDPSDFMKNGAPSVNALEAAVGGGIDINAAERTYAWEFYQQAVVNQPQHVPPLEKISAADNPEAPADKD